MTISHDTMVWAAKSIGLFYLIGMSIAVLCYAYWPSNRKDFDKAAEQILGGDDQPWR